MRILESICGLFKELFPKIPTTKVFSYRKKYVNELDIEKMRDEIKNG